MNNLLLANLNIILWPTKSVFANERIFSVVSYLNLSKPLELWREIIVWFNSNTKLH
jgi:hypothetical protein